MTDNTTLELADVIKALRQELIKAQQEGQDKNIRFNINNVEVELETVIGKEQVAGGGFKTKFFVIDINADANVKFAHASKQKIKLNLQAVTITRNADGSTTSSTTQMNDEDETTTKNTDDSSNTTKKNDEA